MKSSVTKQFRKRFDALPVAVAEQARRAYRQWRADPDHPGLHFKRVSRRQPIFSVRIGIGYRALGLLEGGHIYWFWIGPHHEYDNLIVRL